MSIWCSLENGFGHRWGMKMQLSPLTMKECVARYAAHMSHARGYADRSMHFRDTGDLRRSAWEQNAASSQYRIAREYRECAFVISGQSRNI